MVVEARKSRDEAKKVLREKEAESYILIKNGTNEITGIPKPTEGGIASALDCDPVIKELKQDLINAEFNLGRSQVKEDSMNQKKRMLDNLVELYTKEYYSSPGEKKFSGNEAYSDETRKQLNKKGEKD